MFARLSAFVIWSLVAATAMFWLLRLAVAAPQAPAYAVAVARTAALHGDLSRLFGAAPVVASAAAEIPDVPSRFRLLGVMAPRALLADGSSAYGVALIAIDGKPARAYIVGARVDPDLVLRSVGKRSALIGSARGGGAVTLELPALPPPATGVLPAPGGSMGFTPTMAPTMAPTLPIMSGPLSATAPAPVPAMAMPQPPVMVPAGAAPPLLPTSPDPVRGQ